MDPFVINRLAQRLRSYQPEEDKDEELDNIRNLFTRETPGMSAYREHVSRVPTREDNHLDTLGRIAAILGGLGVSMGTRNPLAGVSFVQNEVDRPYNRAIENYRNKSAGLENVASLDERHLSNERLGETAVENIKTRRAISAQTAEEKKRNYELRMKELETKNASDKEKREETERYHRDIAGLQRESNSIRREANANKSEPLEKIADPNNPGEDILVPRSEASHKTAPKPQALKNRIEQAKAIRTRVKDIRAQIAKVQDSLGPISGRWQILKGKVGIKNPEVRKLHTELAGFNSLMPILHGFRGGIQAHQQFEEAMGNLEQDPANLYASLDAVEKLAEEIENVGGVENVNSNRRTIKLKDGSEVEVQ